MRFAQVHDRIGIAHEYLIIGVGESEVARVIDDRLLGFEFRLEADTGEVESPAGIDGLDLLFIQSGCVRRDRPEQCDLLSHLDITLIRIILRRAE